ncbi:hypothetical protein ABFG93_14215 [Pseudalkalibacillus hwajinpoensis]
MTRCLITGSNNLSFKDLLQLENWLAQYEDLESFIMRFKEFVAFTASEIRNRSRQRSISGSTVIFFQHTNRAMRLPKSFKNGKNLLRMASDMTFLTGKLNGSTIKSR